VVEPVIVISIPLPKILTFNRQIFPGYSSAQCPVAKNSALAKIKERRAALKATTQNANVCSPT
jgi:hypothetical protein